MVGAVRGGGRQRGRAEDARAASATSATNRARAAGARGDAWRERVTEHEHPTVGRLVVGRSEDASSRSKVARPAASERRLSYDGAVPEPLATRRFVRFRARDPSVPRPSLRPLDRSATSASSSRRRMTSSDRTSTSACSPGIPANVVRLDLPARGAGRRARRRYRRAARTLAAWRSDGTLHKDPHPSIYVYEQTYRVPGTRRGPDPARVLRAAASRGVRAVVGRAAARADAAGRARGPLQAAPRDGRQHEPGHRPVRRPGGRRAAGPRRA